MARGLPRSAVVRTAVVVASALAMCSACTTWFGANCSAPPLVVVSGYHDRTAVELWEADGSSKVLTHAPLDSAPALSPDGRTVAFAFGEGEFSDGTGYQQSRVAVRSVNAGKVRVLSADIPRSKVYDLQWAGDGSQIAFARLGLDGDEIVAVDARDGQERRLLALGEGQGMFSWSPDGQELLVPTLPDAPPLTTEVWPEELRRYSIATGGYEVVPTPHTFIHKLAWSPDGRLVALQADIPGAWRLRQYVLNLGTGQSHPVDRRRGGPQSMTWSGSHLLYTYESTVDDAVLLMSWNSRTQERARIDRPGLDRFRGFETTISAPACLG